MKLRKKSIFSGYRFPKEVIMDAVYHKLRYSLSYREIEEILFNKGIEVDHSTIQRWVEKFSSVLDMVFKKNKKPLTSSWYLDETYIKVNGKWLFYYRVIDRNNQTVDYMLSIRRNKKAVKRFLTKCFKDKTIPNMITIDKSGSNTYALKDYNKKNKKNTVSIRAVKYKNNRIEQDHRFIKKRINPMLGFKSIRSADHTLKGIEVVRMIQKNQYIHGNSMSNFEQFMSLLSA